MSISTTFTYDAQNGLHHSVDDTSATPSIIPSLTFENSHLHSPLLDDRSHQSEQFVNAGDLLINQQQIANLPNEVYLQDLINVNNQHWEYTQINTQDRFPSHTSYGSTEQMAPEFADALEIQTTLIVETEIYLEAASEGEHKIITADFYLALSDRLEMLSSPDHGDPGTLPNTDATQSNGWTRTQFTNAWLADGTAHSWYNRTDYRTFDAYTSEHTQIIPQDGQYDQTVFSHGDMQNL